MTGSYENEVLAVDFLKREINFIIQQAHKKQKIDVDHQIVSGSYYLDLKPYGLINVYENVQNIIVRIESENNLNSSLLLNCHFDSVPTSPGIVLIFILILIFLFKTNKHFRSKYKESKN